MLDSTLTGGIVQQHYNRGLLYSPQGRAFGTARSSVPGERRLAEAFGTTGRERLGAGRCPGSVGPRATRGTAFAVAHDLSADWDGRAADRTPITEGDVAQRTCTGAERPMRSGAGSGERAACPEAGSVFVSREW